MGLLRQLLAIAGWDKARVTVSERLLVTDMDDGGMGSIRFWRAGPQERRRLGGRIAELEFSDADGVTVVASLNVDTEGDLFELDIWKTDFGRLIRYPRSGRRDVQGGQ